MTRRICPAAARLTACTLCVATTAWFTACSMYTLSFDSEGGIAYMRLDRNPSYQFANGLLSLHAPDGGISVWQRETRTS